MKMCRCLCRVQAGRAEFGDLSLPTELLPPGNCAIDGETATAFIRTHDLHLSRSAGQPGAMAATITAIASPGPLVRIELEHAASRQRLEAELSCDEARGLNLTVGESIFVSPRRLKLFADDYAI